MLGPEHLGTLQSMHNLAKVLYSQHRYAAAEEMDRQVLELRQQVLGHEHLDTLLSKRRLIKALESQGKLKAAKGISRQLLKLRQLVLGPKNPERR